MKKSVALRSKIYSYLIADDHVDKNAQGTRNV